MDTSQWPQIYEGETNNNNNKKPILIRPNKLELQRPFNCPRCNSTNTKFCYYNNYSLSQPRYLCKTCKRYWTQGGNLRNVPLGGASRKNKKPIPRPQNPKLQTLNLDFNASVSSEFGVYPNNIGFSTLVSNPDPSSVFPSSTFSLDHGYGNSLGAVHQENPLAGLPFDQELIKPFPTTGQFDHQGGSNGYWHGMIDGGGSW